jgi:signal transduction histidine kinase
VRLDLPTLVLILGLTGLAQVAALCLQHRVNRAYRGIGWWLTGAVAMSAGFACLVLGGGVGIRWLGVFGNPLLMFARLCLLVGTRLFLGDRVRGARLWPILAGAVAVYYWFLFFAPSIGARTVVVSLTVAAFSLEIARRLLSARDARFAQAARFTAATFLVHGSFLVLVAGATLARGPIATYLDYSFFQSLVFVVPGVTSTLWTFGFILMMNQRLGAEHRANMDELRRAGEEKAALETRNRQLQKAEGLGRMAGAIAHHYNNQLQVVLGNLERLESASAGAEAGACLAKAKSSTERAAEMSRLLLLYLGQVVPDQALLDLSALCRSQLPALEATLPGRVRILPALPDGGPGIHANAGQIQRVMADLVRNAWEAIGEKAGEIRIGVGTTPAAALPERNRFPVGWQPVAPAYAWLEVRDDGGGIAPADLENLFDPFFSTKFAGRGLGLPVVLGIAQVHGGMVTVTTGVGVGSAFRIHLPLAGA